MNELLKPRETISRLCRPNNRNAFFFVVGAGVSVPHIPTASQMIQEWRMAVAGEINPGSDVKTPLDHYEFWFKQAYLFPRERQQYLQSAIRGKPIGSANYALASILGSDKGLRLVVTTNFDMCLARALTLLGKEPLVYDHPATANSRFRLDPGEVQILHVHGTYQYYDCANLKADIHAQVTRMSSLIGSILNERSPIVVGYSGWEGDVIMTALREHLYESLPPNPKPEDIRSRQKHHPYPVMWFCYRPSELDALPPWLKEHQDVFFIVPHTNALADKLPDREVLQTVRDYTAISQPAEPKLPAEVVFQMFASELDVRLNENAPKIISYHVGELRGVVQGLSDSVVDRVADFTRVLLRERYEIGAIHEALQRLDFSPALEKGIAFVDRQQPENIDSETAKELVDLLCRAALGAGDDSTWLDEAWDRIIALCEMLRSRGQSDHKVEDRWGKAWAGRGLLLLNARRYDESIAAFDHVASQWGPHPPPDLQDVVASSMVNKGIALCRKHLPDSDGPVAQEVLALYDAVLNAHGRSTDPELRETLVSARVNKAYLLTVIGRAEEGMNLYQEVIDTHRNACEPAMREHVVRAMINKAFHLGEMYTETTTQQSHDLYREVTGLFTSGSRPSMRTKMTLAWNGLGWQTILLAKLAIGRRQNPTPLLEQARDAIRRAKDLNPSDGLILGNEAYIEFLAGNKELARRLLENAIRVGGEKTRQTEIDDTTRYPVQDDQEFAGWARSAEVDAGLASVA